MKDRASDLQHIVDRYLRSEASASMVVMELLQFTEDTTALSLVLPTLVGDPVKILELTQHLTDNDAGCCTIVRMIRQRLDCPKVADVVEDGIDRCRKLFDASVAASEESSVALYSLGSPELLAAATHEVIDVFEEWGVCGLNRDALEIGCGIGRLMAPLCSRMRLVVGTDVSPGMISAATRRLKAFSNASVQLTTGNDLSEFATSSMDLVYSVDVFPYMVLSGHTLVERHFREIRRVLRPGGDFVLFNYAYGQTREVVNAQVHALAQGARLQVVRADESPFKIWNGIGWLLRKEEKE